MTDSNTDFQTFPPVPQVVTVAGTALELTPIRLGELPRILAAVRPIAADLSTEPDWLDLLGRHGEAVLELLALATRRDRAWIEGLRTDSLYLFHWTLFGQRIRVSQALSLVMVLVCAGILVYQFKVKKADGSNLFVKRVQQTTEAEEAAAEPTAPDEKK